MANAFRDLLQNRILITGACAWAVSQVLKILIHMIIHREFVLERLFGDGGMPSSHSATVTSVAVTAGLECGLFSQALPGLDAIAVGPTIRGCHTPDEHLPLDSFSRFYQLLTDVLTRLAEK